MIYQLKRKLYKIKIDIKNYKYNHILTISSDFSKQQECFCNFTHQAGVLRIAGFSYYNAHRTGELRIAGFLFGCNTMSKHPNHKELENQILTGHLVTTAQQLPNTCQLTDYIRRNFLRAPSLVSGTNVVVSTIHHHIEPSILFTDFKKRFHGNFTQWLSHLVTQPCHLRC